MSSRPDLSGTTVLFEDDDALAREIVLAFAAEGRSVTRAATHEEVARLLAAHDDAVFVMDRMVEGRDSLEIVDATRRAGDTTPVIVISSLASVDDRIRGLKAGGDDYLVKPFAMGELIARVDALRRRADGGRETRLAVGPLTLDLIERTVRRGDRDIVLLPREFALLAYLMRHAGQVVTRAMLLEDVWNYSMSTQTNVIDVHVGNLRRKIDADGENRLIVSVRGLGFKLAADD